MNLSPNKFWTNVSTRRFVSLLITMIWLSAAMQPCVMASVADSYVQDVVTEHSGNSSIDHGEVAHSACPHCKAGVSDENPCVPQSDENCDSDETLVYYERTKPIDTEILYGQFQTFASNNSRDAKTRTYSTPVSTISGSLYLPAGPPLRDLYQVYLK